jgi:hypothetical protein
VTAQRQINYTCWPCRDEDGRAAVPATYRLLVREVGQKLGDEVWGCGAHICELYVHIISLGKPLDVIVHNMTTGACVAEAHPRQAG